MIEQHQIYIALGANLGDRRHNLVEALQSIRALARIEKISSCYETKPVGYLDQPNFLNMVCQITSNNLSPFELLSALKQIEKQMGRQKGFRNAPRPIDLDILFYDDLVLESPELTIPHPRLPERAFVLTPLAEIAPDFIHPTLKLSATELLQRVDRSGVALLPRGLQVQLTKDVQKSRPETHVSLSRVGVTDIHRIIRITRSGQENLFYAQIDLFADLDPDKMGIHMSRFSDVLEETADGITLEKYPNIETLAGRIARQIVDSQGAIRSEARIRAVYPMEKFAPVSGKKTQELYTFISIAVCNQDKVKHVIGVEVDGFTACPCAQEMATDYSRERLAKEGFTDEQIEKVLKSVPIASHNQRGRGTLLIGSDQEIAAEDLVRLIEVSMSSETYDLLKRPDELYVILKAHRNPRFVEDVVREMLQNVVDIYTYLPDSTFVSAKQINFESIHKHNAFAERFGTLGEIRQEILEGQYHSHHTTLDEWLEN
jgi:GTP cyclohydrolase-4